MVSKNHRPGAGVDSFDHRSRRSQEISEHLGGRDQDRFGGMRAGWRGYGWQPASAGRQGSGGAAASLTGAGRLL